LQHVQATPDLPPRASSSPEIQYAVAPSPPLQPISSETHLKFLRVYDFRQEPILSTDLEIFFGPTYDLIQTVPAVWLSSSKIREAFIPLLRGDRITTKDRPPTASELRLIEGFLNHIPEVHILPEDHVSRSLTRSSSLDYKRNLNLSSAVRSFNP
jgi:hypothetical protein